MDNTFVKEKLTAKFGDALTNWEEPYGMLTFTALAELNLKVMQFLYDDEELRFQFLTDLQAVHYPLQKGEELAVVYHLHNWYENKRIRVKTFLNGTKPEVKSITSLFNCANWMERETFDFYGIIFHGHPNLVRILNMDEMTSFPMRKEFPMEDSGRTDKDDRFFGRTINNSTI